MLPKLRVLSKPAPRHPVSKAVAEAKKKGIKLVAKKKRPMTPLAAVNSRFEFGEGQPRGSKYWDFKRDGVSISGIGTFLQCHEQFRLKYVEGWEGGGYSFPMEFGSCFHWIHKEWISNKDFDLGVVIKNYRKQWLVDHATSSPQARDEQETGYAMALALWPEYDAKYHSDLDLKWLGVEDYFKVPLKLPDGRNTWLRGFMDGAYLAPSGTVCLHEMKTKSRIDFAQIEEALWLDLQVMTYLYILKVQYPNKEFEVQYDVIRRPGTYPHQRETITQYKGRLVTLVQKDPKYYFQRVRLKVTHDHIDQFVSKVLMPIMQDVADWSEGKLRHYPTPDALVGRYGPVEMYNALVNQNFTALRRKSPSKEWKEM